MGKVSIIKGRLAKLEAKRAELVRALSASDDAMEAMYGALEAAEAAESLAASIDEGLPAGTVVGYAFGRDKTRADYVGVVRAVKTDVRGVVTYRIETGEGFDAVIHTVPSAAIKDIIPPVLGAGHYTEVA